jgi:hypothetical protein
MPAVTALRPYEQLMVGSISLKSEIPDRRSYDPLLELIEYVKWATKTRIDEMRLTAKHVLHVELNPAVGAYTADKIAEELEGLSDVLKFDHNGIWVATKGHVARVLAPGEFDGA